MPFTRLFIHNAKSVLIPNQEGLIDYKFYCFNGKPQLLYVSYDLTNRANSRLAFYDLQQEKMPYDREDYASIDEHPIFPDSFNAMIKIAKKLSERIPFVRMDLYIINGELYFLELTFNPCDSYMKFKPEKYDGVSEICYYYRKRIGEKNGN